MAAPKVPRAVRSSSQPQVLVDGKPPGRLPKFEVIEGRKQSADWDEEPSSMTMGELVEMQTNIRAIVSRLRDYNFRGYVLDHLLQSFERELHSASARYPGLMIETNGPLIERVLVNVCRVLPTPEGFDLLHSVYNRLKEWREGLDRPHVVRANARKGRG